MRALRGSQRVLLGLEMSRDRVAPGPSRLSLRGLRLVRQLGRLGPRIERLPCLFADDRRRRGLAVARRARRPALLALSDRQQLRDAVTELRHRRNELGDLRPLFGVCLLYTSDAADE